MEAAGQGFESQAAFQPIRRRPADYASGEEVHHDGKVQPLFGRPDMAGIDSPFLIRGICGEVPVNDVPGDWLGMMTVGRTLKKPFPTGLQAIETQLWDGDPLRAPRAAALRDATQSGIRQPRHGRS